MDESVYLKRCIFLIEEKLIWGESRFWTNKDYLKLSQEISIVSKISISTDTLKRIFGKIKTYKSYYNPQDETKNALAIFIGYESWEKFKSENHNLIRVEKPIFFHSVILKYKNKLIGLVIFFLAVVLFLTYNSRIRDQSPKFEFSGSHLTGYSPHTSIFTYDISTIKSDCVFIDYDYRYPMLEKLPKNSHMFTTIHMDPGYYKVKLLLENRILSSKGVSVLTKNWETELQTPDGIKYKLDSNFISQHAERLDDREIKAAGSGKIKQSLKFLNYKDFGADGDDIVLETRSLNNKESGGLTCYDIQLQLICEYGKIDLLFVEEGCHKFAKFEASEVLLKGDNNDLSALGQNLSTWRVIKIKVKNKNCEIYFDGLKTYAHKYKTVLGKLKGIEVIFKGSGRLDYVKLHTGEGKLVHFHDF